MARPEVVRRRLEKLAEYLRILRQMQSYSLEEFLASPERYGAAERFLQLAIESVDDLASHVLADAGIGPVNASRDLARLFREQGWVDAMLEQKWVRMIGFRNVLVHEYVELDRRLVFRSLQEGLEDLEALQRVFARFL